MFEITAIVIDDEKNSREAFIKKLQMNCPDVQLLCECSNGKEGIDAINTLRPWVVFLDIEMPQMNGFAMLQQLSKKDFHLVFTTAYNQYAIDAIRFSAFDYLVKPVDVNELINTINRIKEKSAAEYTGEKLDLLITHLVHEKKQPSKIAIATMEGIDFVPMEEIVYLEAVGNYTTVHVKSVKPILASKTLKEFEDILPANRFCRVHNGSIVNITFIQKFIKGDGGQIVLSNGVLLDVARRRKEELLKLMAGFSARI